MLHHSNHGETPIRSVLHPTDHRRGGAGAFAHALAIALTRQSKLTLLHVGPEHHGRVRWSKFPPVRKTLEKWGVLDADSPQSAVEEKLNMRVKKVAVPSRRPVRATASYLAQCPADLIVLSTQGRTGLPRWIDPSVAEPLARKASTLTLFVPSRARRGLIQPKTGDLRLRSILLPVHPELDFHVAMELACGTAACLGKGMVDITLAHVGSEAMYWPALEDGEHWCWHRAQFPGDPVKQILAAATRVKADLIVMPTRGHDGILDMLRGSTTEQVLRMANCPVLAVPAR